MSTKFRTYPTTELQHLAQRENYALFQIKGMHANTVHLVKAKVSGRKLLALYRLLNEIQDEIKHTQETRKLSTKTLKETKNETYTEI